MITYFTECNWSSENFRRLEKLGPVTEVDVDNYTESGPALSNTILIHPMMGVDLSVFDNLTIVASNTTSDEFIDTAHCRENEIKVLTLAGQEMLQDITATAEHTLALILAAYKRIPLMHERSMRGSWTRWESARDLMLSEMTLGIIGGGRVGQHLFKRASHLFMETFVFDPPKGIGNHILAEYEPDVIAICCSLTPQTRGMINEEFLNKMQRRAILVNTARGDIINDRDLLNHLDRHPQFSAALDVLPGEFEYPRPRVFWDYIDYARGHSNLILTPHIAGSTYSAWDKTQRAIIDMIWEEME